MGRLSALIASIVLLAVLATGGEARGAAGEPDPTFGLQGFSFIDEPAAINEDLSDVVVLPDGKILGGGGRGQAGGFLLARFNADGSPDLGFGPDGVRVEPDLEQEPGLGTAGSPRDIAGIELRADGKLVVVGLGRGPGKFNAMQFGRYLPSGALDPTFGDGGLTTMWFSMPADALAVAQAPDGRVVAAGATGLTGPAVVARVTEGGQPDGAFHSVTPGGIRLVDVPESDGEEAYAVDVAGDGSVVLGGYSDGGAFLAKLQSNGEPAAGFGSAGIAVHDLGSDLDSFSEIDDLKVLPDGRILATGTCSAGTGDSQAFVARFTPAGDLDPSFGQGGVSFANPTSGAETATSLELLDDGRILVGGRRGETGIETSDGQAWLFRLTPQGQLDPSFGTGGEAFASPSPGTDSIFGLALQPDGRAVVVGEGNFPASVLMAGRFTADPPPPAGPSPAAAPRRCAGKVATITGTGRADKLTGTRGRDVIVALGGADKIAAGAGNDLVCAGAGRDGVLGQAGKDIIRGEAGPDSLFGQGGSDRLLGGAGHDRLFGGGAKKDRCIGGPGRKDHSSRSCERSKSVP